MSYDQHLEQSVWDDDSKPSAFNELTSTFANTGLEEPNWDDSISKDDNDEHEDIGSFSQPSKEPSITEFYSKSHSPEPLENSPLTPSGFQDTHIPSTNIFATPETTKNSLLSELAPEEDPLSQITATVSKPALEGELFNDFQRSPIKAFEEEAEDSNIKSPTKAHGKKPNMLFNIQRRQALKKSDKKAKPMDKKIFVDPLAKMAEQAEFVDEPLEENATQPLTVKNNETNADRFASSTESNRDTPSSIYEQQSHHQKSPLKNPSETIDKFSNENESTDVDESIYEIDVTDPTKVGDITGSHMEYKVRTKVDDQSHVVSRRYRDFRWLYRQLQSNHWGNIIPPPPDKQVFNRFVNDLTETRRAQMSLMLNKIASNTVLKKDPDFIEFLTYEGTKLSTYSKTRDQDSLAQSINDSNDLSEIYLSEIGLFGQAGGIEFHRSTGGTDIESYIKKKLKGGSFLSFYAAPTPKYNDPDPFFTTHLESIAALKDQLKDISKAMEMVVQEKLDLAAVTKEFSISLNNLIELNVSPKLTDVYKSFAKVHVQLEESFERNAQMENLVLGSTLEEHVRSLSSCIAIFNQRFKLGTLLVLFEQLVQNTKISLSKAKGEKVSKVEEELKSYETKYDQIKKHWKHIGEKIKQQIDLFDKQRIVEFRNSIEIYLESAIESQKEAIEIWETFYQTAL